MTVNELRKLMELADGDSEVMVSGGDGRRALQVAWVDFASDELCSA